MTVHLPQGATLLEALELRNELAEEIAGLLHAAVYYTVDDHRANPDHLPDEEHPLALSLGGSAGGGQGEPARTVRAVLARELVELIAAEPSIEIRLIPSEVTPEGEQK